MTQVGGWVGGWVLSPPPWWLDVQDGEGRLHEPACKRWVGRWVDGWVNGWVGGWLRLT